MVLKDRFLTVAAGSHMIERAAILDAQRSGHDVTSTTGLADDAILDLTPNPTRPLNPTPVKVRESS